LHMMMGMAFGDINNENEEKKKKVINLIVF
jgi:hypothetical protein